jgi:hypothetical protein
MLGEAVALAEWVLVLAQVRVSWSELLEAERSLWASYGQQWHEHLVS